MFKNIINNLLNDDLFNEKKLVKLVSKDKYSRSDIYNYNNHFIIKKWNNKPMEHNKDLNNSILFYKELNIYKRLKDYDFIPKLLYYDENEFIIIINFCGEHLKLKDVNKKVLYKFEEILKILKNKKIKHNDLAKVSSIDSNGMKCAKYFTNILINNEKIFIIDFEWSTENDEESIKHRNYNDNDIIFKI